MKSSIIVSILAGSAVAFAPSSQTRSTSALAGSVSNPLSSEIGAMAPLGYFDPWGLCDDEDKENFDRLREVELRHGRCSMLATVGWLTTAAGYRLPGLEDIPAGFKALNLEGQSFEVRSVLPATVGTIFLLTVSMQDYTGNAEFRGDYRNGFDFGWDRQTDEWKAKKRSIEVNNGRAAMMGILGIMVHEQLGNLGAIGLPTP